MKELTTPVVFIIFNRPDTTKRVFEKIREAKPKKLYIIADGPRKSVPKDYELCQLTRSMVENIDWDCNLYKNYSDINLGSRFRPASGFEFVFRNEDDAIILEDDCLPHTSFFEYCQQLLEYFRNEKKINIISGSNFLSKLSNKKYSYQFSAFHHFWGWATWKRAWEKYDIDMKEWPVLKNKNFINDILMRRTSAKYWETLFEEVYTGKINTAWDYQWIYSSWKNNGLAVLPTSNLISNIGFGENATHTKNKKHKRSNMPLEGVQFPIIHPPQIKRDFEYDQILSDYIFRFNRRDQIIRLIKKILRF